MLMVAVFKTFRMTQTGVILNVQNIRNVFNIGRFPMTRFGSTYALNATFGGSCIGLQGDEHVLAVPGDDGAM